MDQDPVSPVAFTGAPGAYSQEAALRFFGSSYPTLTCSSVSDAVAALTGKRAVHAVLPVENSITGAFAGVPEAIGTSEVHVLGEVVLPIRHCLLGAPGARLDDIAVVRSHPTALAQCRDWLARWGVATRVSADTAEAARELAASRDAALGVIGSASLASMYGLETLAEGVSDHADNRTRFYVLGDGVDAVEADAPTRCAFLIGPVDTPRTLKTLRIQLESRGATRTRAPFLGSEDGRLAVVEFDHPSGGGAGMVAAVCADHRYRYLGSWEPAASGLPAAPPGGGA
ncbi:MAG: prephenate dehydratase domain-containing protein [Planctomycetota bacterium]